jgi:murein DD-endopeptidase MepM/ murein hydrolase activator NlpD
MLLLVLLYREGTSQTTPAPKSFRSPIDFPILLSGTFGEVRANHFHSGIDIRTGGQTGKPVYAVADGYVSRIFVSPYGFGKALYVNHPSGYTTVCGHLDRFSAAIGKYVKEQQYRSESFSIDLEVPPGTFPVRQGDIIGYSGNSGSSGGPHLHFEVRDAATQEPMDPITSGIPLTDRTRPRIIRLAVYPHGGNDMVNHAFKPCYYTPVYLNGSYKLPGNDTIPVSGGVFFGIEAYDYQENSTMRNGIRTIELQLDGRRVFRQDVGRFAFSETRFVNSVIDYPMYLKNKYRIQRTYIAPGNRIDIYDDVAGRGVVNFSDNGIHAAEYIVTDSWGNSSRLRFFLKSHPPPPGGARPPAETPAGEFFPWDESNSFETGNILLEMPANALYEDIYFRYEELPPLPGTWSGVHRIHTPEVPLQESCMLSISPSELPESLSGKAIIAKVEKTGKLSGCGGAYQDGFVQTRIREFGDYTVTVDTIPPTVKPVNIYSGKNISKQTTISITISDDFSGIASYRGTLNGKWILMDYDPKKNLLVYRYDDRIQSGLNKFRLVVKDQCGNQTEYSANLTR